MDQDDLRLPPEDDFVYIDEPDFKLPLRPRSKPVHKYSLSLEQRIDGYKAKKKDFEPIFGKAIRSLKRDKKLAKKMKGGLVELVLVSDEEIRLLNDSYRGKSTTTDVISLSYFEQELEFPGADLAGEIFISLDTARRQAKEHKMTLTAELQFLFVHGVLHIFGFDHQKPKERKTMFDLQDRILATKKWRKIAEKDALD